MPPILALVLCTAFVAYLLKVEHKQSPEVSRALWIPTIWMFLIASKPLGVWLQTSSADAEAGSPIDRAFLLGLLILAIIQLFKGKFSWAGVLTDNIWIVVLITYMLVSISWSGMPFTSLKRWMREFQAIIMGLMLLNETSPRQAIQCILRRTIYVLIPFSLVLSKYFPEYGVVYNQWGTGMWIGVTLHKNTLGRLCLIAVFFLIWTLARRRQGRNPSVFAHQGRLELIVFLMALYLMIGPGGYSATAVTALIIGLVIYGGFSLLRKHGKVMGAAVPLIVVVAIIALGVISVFTNASFLGGVAPVVGRNSTLTDRTGIWETLIPVVRQNPLFGKGIGGFWTLHHREIFQFSEAHSGYLDSIIEFGFLGLILISAFLLATVRKAQRLLSHDFYWGILCICFVIMAAFHNVTESSINTLDSPLTAFIIWQSILSAHFLRSSPDAAFRELSGAKDP